MMDHQFASLAIGMGADKAYVLPVSEIPFDAALREFCVANRCGHYNRNYACPPSVGEPQAVIAQAKGYENALIFQTISALEDSFDFEGMMEAAANHNELTNRMYAHVKQEQPGCLPLSAGGCSICARCAKIDDLPCRFPEKAISSLEAYCINVSSLAEKCGMKYINGVNTVTYFSAILF